MAKRAAAPRVDTPILVQTCWMWWSAVLAEITAISALVMAGRTTPRYMAIWGDFPMPRPGRPAHDEPMTTTTNNAITTDNDTHRAAIQRLYAAFGKVDLDAVLAELADDVDWAAEAASTSVPWYGRYQGRSEVPRFLPGNRVERRHLEVRHPGPLVGRHRRHRDRPLDLHRQGDRQDGEHVHAAWFRFAGDQVVLFRGSADSQQSAAAFSAA